MKLLLDENLHHQIRLEIEDHEILTVAFGGWRAPTTANGGSD